MRRTTVKLLLFWLVAAGTAALFFTLPMLGGDAFLSPDETANATFARAFARSSIGRTSADRPGAFRVEDAVLERYPWAHPRSVVTHGGAMVPVGFLGVPAIAAVMFAIGGDWWLVFFSPIVALSVCYPLWRLFRGMGRMPAAAGVIAWLSFPTVILYANRGLFPNLIVVSLAIWGCYVLKTNLQFPISNFQSLLAGCSVGLALSVRPVEAVWILPWVAFTFWMTVKHHPGEKVRVDRNGKMMRLAVVWFLTGLFIVSGLFAVLGYQTYGEWFTAGYAMRDPIDAARETIAPAETGNTDDLLPFGFHPRNIWFNIKSYLIIYLWPWFLLSLAGFALWWRRRTARPWIVLVCWTGAVLLLVYGSGIYQDHVRLGAVTVGNSFLRYLLPLVPFAALLAASLASRAAALPQRAVRAAVFGILFVGIPAFGVWTATVRDDEGVAQNRIELRRYAEIRRRAEEILSEGTLVFSERSDKIFFPTFRAVSPLPAPIRVDAFLKDGDIPTALYLRTLDEKAREEWAERGFTLRPILSAGNETLYLPEPL